MPNKLLLNEGPLAAWVINIVKNLVITGIWMLHLQTVRSSTCSLAMATENTEREIRFEMILVVLIFAH